jgi:hypothetical protein
MIANAETSADLLCHRCGYDLRAHPQNGKCPECGTSVAESRQIAAIPPRPAWRDSDPRWRRRMLSGIWILIFLPLVAFLQASGLDSRIRVPGFFEIRGTIRTLDDTLLFNWGPLYQSMVFCIGVVLLFSNERKRRSSPLDWTRRWGVFGSYLAFLLSVAPILRFSALVLAGIASLFLSMPLKYQPAVTQLFVHLSYGYLRYGPSPKVISSVAVLPALSSILILLACVPLLNALRSSGPKWAAASLLAVLALLALWNLSQVGGFCLGFSSMTLQQVYFSPVASLAVYFQPAMLPYPDLTAVYLFEAEKWCIVLTIAMWLSIAQFLTWRQSKAARP